MDATLVDFLVIKDIPEKDYQSLLPLFTNLIVLMQMYLIFPKVRSSQLTLVFELLESQDRVLRKLQDYPLT